MAFTMEITDGTTTIDILQTNDTTVGYHLQTESYTPQINRRNPSDFGSVYLPVLESFNIAIVGSSANDVHVKLAALVNLMDNVRLWFDSDAAAADAVTFVFKPSSSTESAEYQALIVSDAEVGYSQYIEHIGNWYRMPDVRVSFMRNEWLGEEETAVSASAVQPSVLQATFGSVAGLPSPVDIEFSSPFGGTATIGDRVAFISPVDITYMEAETMSGVGSGSVSSVAIAGASGGAVASFSAATVTTDSIYHTFPSGGAYFLYNNFSVWATLRNPSTTTAINWTIKTTHDIGSATTTGQLQSVTTVIESGRTYPRIVYLGSFFVNNSYAQTVSNQIELFVTNDAADGTGNGDLEIDTITIHNIDTDADGTFFLNRVSPDGVWGTVGQVLSKPSGIVYNSDSALPAMAVSHTGNSRQKTVGDDVYALFLDVTDTPTGWITPGSAAARTYTLTATRRLASLTPL